MDEGTRSRNKSSLRQLSKRSTEPLAPQRRASGSKERAPVKTGPGRPASAPSARNGTPKSVSKTPSRDGPPGGNPAGVHRVARQILAASPSQDVVHINLQHPITSYISPSETSVSSKVPSPASPNFHPDEVATHRPDEAELLRAELAELKRNFQAREAQLLQQVEALCGELAATGRAKEAAEAELRRLRGEPSRGAGGLEREVNRQGEQLQRLLSQFERLEAEAQERHHAEKSRAVHLEELIRSSQSQQQQFCSDLQALWAEVSRLRPTPGPRTGEERVNDLAANALLRNIYSSVSELP